MAESLIERARPAPEPARPARGGNIARNAPRTQLLARAARALASSLDYAETLEAIAARRTPSKEAACKTAKVARVLFPNTTSSAWP